MSVFCLSKAPTCCSLPSAHTEQPMTHNPEMKYLWSKCPPDFTLIRLDSAPVLCYIDFQRLDLAREPSVIDISNNRYLKTVSTRLYYWIICIYSYLEYILNSVCFTANIIAVYCHPTPFIIIIFHSCFYKALHLASFTFHFSFHLISFQLKELGTSRTHSAVIRCLTICQHIPVVRKNHKNQLTQQFDIIGCLARCLALCIESKQIM